MIGAFIAVCTIKCTNKYELPENLEVHDFVWKGLNAYYLYQDQIPDLSDTRFYNDQQLENYLSGFETPNDLFPSLLIAEDTKSVFVEDDTSLSTPTLRTSFTHGLEFGILLEPSGDEDENNVLGYVLQILPNSDAATKDISRGEFFNAVDGEQLTRENYANLLLNGTETFTLSMVDFDGTTITPNGKTVELIKSNYTYQPISMTKEIAPEVGYLVYDHDFSSNYINDLNNSFLELKNQSVTKLILDLRYNIGGGGFVKNITEIAAMITGQFPDEVLINEEWNVKAQPWFLANQPDSLQTKFPTQLNQITPINSIQATDVYIILNGSNYQGSSAIELLVNSLKSHINVTLFGNQTSGNNTGAITLYNSIDYDEIGRNSNHNAILQPLVLRFLNKDNETYENGFLPDVQLCIYEDILNLGVLGELSDPLLNAVVNYADTGSTGTTTDCNPFDFEFLYHSIDSQRIVDTGMFITQDLPNTY